MPCQRNGLDRLADWRREPQSWLAHHAPVQTAPAPRVSPAGRRTWPGCSVTASRLPSSPPAKSSRMSLSRQIRNSVTTQNFVAQNQGHYNNKIHHSSSCNASNNQIEMQRSNWQEAQLLVVLSCAMTLHKKAPHFNDVTGLHIQQIHLRDVLSRI